LELCSLSSSRTPFNASRICKTPSLKLPTNLTLSVGVTLVRSYYLRITL